MKEIGLGCNFLSKMAMRKFLACGIFFSVWAGVSVSAQEQKIHYISPNNDGVQDELVIPMKITDKKFIHSWTLHVFDENGNEVRSVGNKMPLPEKLTFKSFFKKLVTPKGGISTPQSVTWNGVMDSGELAPDGVYTYYVTASDDNGNTSRTADHTVIVDTVPPAVTVTTSADKVFGAGEKADFKITQSGSAEDKWTGVIRSASGEAIREYEWKGEPQPFLWNGMDGKMNIAPDGVYSYEISATDRAGNKFETVAVQNIIYSGEKHLTNIKINGSRYFSPGTESVKSTMDFDVSVPLPRSAANKITEWKIDIIDISTNRVVHRTFSGGENDNPPRKISFDGKNENGEIIPDGRYQARLDAKYLNGFVANTVYSPVFSLDTKPVVASVDVADKVFGGGNKTNITISQSTIPKDLTPSGAWEGRIFSSDDTERKNTIKKFVLGIEPSAEVVWDGFNDEGKLAKNGEYVYELSSVDLAGNPTKVVSAPFSLDTTDADILISVWEKAFSPNGDGMKDEQTFTPVFLTGVGGVSSYNFSIMDKDGNVVHTQNGTKAPETLYWDGKTDGGELASDGVYVARIDSVSANGAEASVVSTPFVLDTQPPKAVIENSWSAFSPEETSTKQTLPVKVTESTEEPIWVANIKDKTGFIVKHLLWSGQIKSGYTQGFEWDATDDSGNTVPDGTYSMEIVSVDDAGNKFEELIQNIVVDSRQVQAFITRASDGISPNGDGKFEVQDFSIKMVIPDGIASWKFEVRDEKGTAVKTWTDDGKHVVPEKITWDGRDENGTAGEGTYIGVLTASYEKGNELQSMSAPFICTATPPALSVAATPQYFSPDNDGTDDDLFIKLGAQTKAAVASWSFVINDPAGKRFWHTEGQAKIKEQLMWDGLSNTQKGADGLAERVASAVDYPYTFTVTDTLGMTSTAKGIIPIDVLVIREGNVLKMAVPSIIFRSDHADFNVETRPGAGNGLRASQAANNERVLKRIAEILNKFPDYKVTVTGHANRTTDNDLEETEDSEEWGRGLIPLSQERADFVRRYLIRLGVAGQRLSTKGMGGTQPVVADREDRGNSWKNRRVEFILQK